MFSWPASAAPGRALGRVLAGLALAPSPPPPLRPCSASSCATSKRLSAAPCTSNGLLHAARNLKAALRAAAACAGKQALPSSLKPNAVPPTVHRAYRALWQSSQGVYARGSAERVYQVGGVGWGAVQLAAAGASCFNPRRGALPMLWRADLTAPARARPAPCPAPRQVFFWTHERCRLRMAEGGLDMPAPILTQIFGALQKGIEAFEHCRCEMRERHPTDGLLQRSEGSGSSARQQSLLQHSRAAAPQAAPATAPPPLMQTCATRPSPSPGPRCSPSCCCACSSPCPLPSSTRVGRHGRGGHSPAGRAPAAGCVPPTLTAQRASHRPTCASFPRPPAVNDVALGIVMAAVTVQVRAPKRRCAPTRAWTQPGSRQHVCLPVLVPTAPAPLSPLKRCVSHPPTQPHWCRPTGP